MILKHNLKKCSKCQNDMELGFLIDHGRNDAVHVGKWAPGTPSGNWWSGISKKGALDIISYRCTNCEYLELYTTPSLD